MRIVFIQSCLLINEMNIICHYDIKLNCFLAEVVKFVLCTYAQDLDLSKLREIALFRKEDFSYSFDGRTIENGTKIILTSRLFDVLPCFNIEKISNCPDFALIVNTLYHEMGHVNDWRFMPKLYREVIDADDPKDIMAIRFWLEYIAEKRSYQSGLARNIYKEYCETFVKWDWPAKDFNYEHDDMNNYFYLVKATPYFMARSIDPLIRNDYLGQIKNPVLQSFIVDLDREIKLLDTYSLFDDAEPLSNLSQIIQEYRQRFLDN